MGYVGGVGGPCDFGVSPSPFDLDFGTLDFGTSDSGLTINQNPNNSNRLNWVYFPSSFFTPHHCHQLSSGCSVRLSDGVRRGVIRSPHNGPEVTSGPQPATGRQFPAPPHAEQTTRTSHEAP